MINTLPPATPTKTSINLIITCDQSRHYDTLVNAGTDYYEDGIPAILYCQIMQAVCNVVEEWNNKHK